MHGLRFKWFWGLGFHVFASAARKVPRAVRSQGDGCCPPTQQRWNACSSLDGPVRAAGNGCTCRGGQLAVLLVWYLQAGTNGGWLWRAGERAAKRAAEASCSLRVAREGAEGMDLGRREKLGQVRWSAGEGGAAGRTGRRHPL